MMKGHGLHFCEGCITRYGRRNTEPFLGKLFVARAVDRSSCGVMLEALHRRIANHSVQCQGSDAADQGLRSPRCGAIFRASHRISIRCAEHCGSLSSNKRLRSRARVLQSGHIAQPDRDRQESDNSSSAHRPMSRLSERWSRLGIQAMGVKRGAFAGWVANVSQAEDHRVLRADGLNCRRLNATVEDQCRNKQPDHDGRWAIVPVPAFRSSVQFCLESVDGRDGREWVQCPGESTAIRTRRRRGCGAWWSRKHCRRE